MCSRAFLVLFMSFALRGHRSPNLNGSPHPPHNANPKRHTALALAALGRPGVRKVGKARRMKKRIVRAKNKTRSPFFGFLLVSFLLPPAFLRDGSPNLSGHALPNGSHQTPHGASPSWAMVFSWCKWVCFSCFAPSAGGAPPPLSYARLLPRRTPFPLYKYSVCG